MWRYAFKQKEAMQMGAYHRDVKCLDPSVVNPCSPKMSGTPESPASSSNEDLRPQFILTATATCWQAEYQVWKNNNTQPTFAW